MTTSLERALAVLAICPSLAGAPQSSTDLEAFRALTPRTQEIVGLVAVQARMPALIESDMASEATDDRDLSPFTEAPTASVMAELRAWVDANGSDLLILQLDRVEAVEEEILVLFYATMTAVSADGYARTESNMAKTDWVMTRWRLAQKKSVAIWEGMLWTLISEVEEDSIARVALWDDAIAFADLQLDQP